ncbi:carbon storage regulator CsrA [Paenibacillus sp. MSJ-34]|uniref:carbon storage regulator CsrA n=1 Tax=Paenibacillus sp. MSJ-34 TaxID=2841529 RepID=UPI001C1092D4|nr:carbon storage regulator CsrA [Paenibacillus sp. MSJ-34]MBU5440985.1 carbon storage regulator CsrA [Paenibacillus sp. MSJ-34]
MLVLKRKVGERIMIGDHIEVQILGIEGENIKLGFVAPKNVQILRHELYEGIMAENMSAGHSGKPDQMVQLLKQYKS